jgi:hypothetical protein
LRNRLAALLGQSLPVSFIFDYPNLGRIADRFLVVLALRSTEDTRALDDSAEAREAVSKLSPEMLEQGTDELVSELLARLQPTRGT